jgi:homopolymeric O-antigen transport system permease protein
MSGRIVVYEPNQRVKVGFWAGWTAMVRGVVNSRELIWQLFKRDFFANYKQSYLGIVWVFIAPVVGIVSWVFLNATGVLSPGDVGVPYPVYVLIGSTVWGLFMSFYSNTSKSLSEYKTLIQQINFPHEALVLKQMAQTVAAFVINMGLILVVLIVFKVLPSWKIVLFPLTVVPLMLVGSGIGMVVAVVSAVANDLEKAATALLGFVMYITPVIYAPEQKSELIRTVVYWNPLSYLVGGARDIILYGRIASPAGYAVSSGLTVVLFFFTWRLFYLSEHKVAERL